MTIRPASALVLLFVVLVGLPADARACPVCFQVEAGPVTTGVQAAVLVLVGVTTGVLSGFGLFIARFVRRARRMR